MPEYFKQLKDLAVKEQSVEAGPSQAQVDRSIDAAKSSLFDAILSARDQKAVPAKLKQALADATDKYEEAIQAPEAGGASAAPSETMPTEPPDKSTWMMGVLVILVVGGGLAAFLFRDGIRSNAIRLVNLVFAGLLAMNFFEPLAAYVTNYNEDIHSFAPFLDFLAFWICFIFFMVVLMAITDKVSRVRVRFLQIVEQIGSPIVATCIGWVMAGIVLASMHTAPLAEYSWLGTFQPQNVLRHVGPDREWLASPSINPWGPLPVRFPRMPWTALASRTISFTSTTSAARKSKAT